MNKCSGTFSLFLANFIDYIRSFANNSRMFVREKTARGHTHLYLVESVREGGGCHSPPRGRNTDLRLPRLLRLRLGRRYRRCLREKPTAITTRNLPGPYPALLGPAVEFLGQVLLYLLIGSVFGQKEREGTVEVRQGSTYSALTQTDDSPSQTSGV